MTIYEMLSPDIRRQMDSTAETLQAEMVSLIDEVQTQRFASIVKDGIKLYTIATVKLLLALCEELMASIDK